MFYSGSKADLFPECQTYEWDSAAGQAIIEGAGGQVLQMNNKPMIYGRRDKKKSKFYCLWTKILDKILKENDFD